MTVASAAPRAPGRPRNDAVTTRVEEVARKAFAERGFGAVTMSGLASAAGVGLDSIYRRWPSKQALLVDVVADAVTADVRVPDTGSVERDLLELLVALAHAVDGDLGVLLSMAVAESAHDPALAARLADAQAVRRDMTLQVVARAARLGQLPGDVDAHLLLDALAGLVWQRAWLRRVPLTPAEAEAAVTHLLRGFAGGQR